MARKEKESHRKPREAPRRAPLPTRSLAYAPYIAPSLFLAYLVLLTSSRDIIPAGLNNDAAEEALRGIYLVAGHHFEVLTTVLGHSAETLYLYLMGASAQLLGPTTLAIQTLSWIFALACIWMIAKTARRIDDAVPLWLPLLTAMCSLWLLHYARSGLRAISAPFFLLAFVLLLDLAERRPSNRLAPLAAGAVLALGIYGYTSARILPIAFVLYAIVRLIRANQDRAAAVQRYALVIAGAIVVSIPNLIFFVRKPADFLGRGNYVLRGAPAKRILNIIFTALLPLYYPSGFRTIAGPSFYFDGVSAGLTGAGFSPLHIILAAAMLAGLYRFRRYLDRPAALFLLVSWIVAVLALGIAGPSLTRLLVILPVYLIFAALGFAWFLEAKPRLWLLVPLVLIIVAASTIPSYLSGAGAAPDYYAAVATPIGETAATLAAQGQNVRCVVSRDASVVSYLTGKQSAHIRISEFFNRPVNPMEILFTDFKAQVLLIENTPQFSAFIRQLPVAWIDAQDTRFYVIHFPQK